jgi:SsrA-binding protein
VSAKTGEAVKVIALNKKARHLYEILGAMEAGLSLTGSEVKSMRAGKVNFKDSYVKFTGAFEAVLVGLHVSPYENAGYAQHEPERDRKLLLHEHEIRAWKAKVEQKGLTVVPLKLYLKRGRIKLEIGLARGKNVHDRKDALKERDLDREAKRERDRY